jgi:cytochrome b pre-mRNA-processing protein 3
MILPGFRHRSQNRTIRALYGAVVAQARVAAFYADFGVPDTIEGRFDLIVLHLVLLLRRLGSDSDLGRRLGQNLGQNLGQDLFDEFCRDLDANLREMGVGDLAVPKRMQGFAEAFYGRQAAYLEAIAAADREAFENALSRNIFTGNVEDGAARLTRYAYAAMSEMAGQADDALLRGEVAFPRPGAIA